MKPHQTDSNRLGTLAALATFAILLGAAVLPARGENYINWNGNDASGHGNFSYCDNWYYSSCPTWAFGTEVDFSYVGNDSSGYDDLGSWVNIDNIVFDSSFAAGWTWSTAGNGINFNAKIENDSSYTQTWNIPTSGSLNGAGSIQLNPVSGNLILGQPVYNDNAVEYLVYGQGSHQLVLNADLVGGVSGKTGVALNMEDLSGYYSVVDVKAAQTWGGSSWIYINSGELWIDSGGSLAAGQQVQVGDGSGNNNISKLWLTSTYLSTFPNNITVYGYSGLLRVIGGLNSSGNNTLSGNITLNYPVSLIANASGGTVKFSGVISGSGEGVTIAAGTSSSGTVVLSGANTYSGGTTINSGTTLQLGAANTIPGNTTAGDVTDNGILDLNTHSDTINGLNGSGTVNTAAGGTPTLTVGANGDSGTFSGVIENTAGTLALTKSGSGTETLTGANTYSGNTTINAGTLLADNSTSSTGSGTVTVNSGGTLGGTGKISGATTVASGGTLLVGNTAIGTLTFGSTLSLAGTTTMGINASTPAASEIVNSGTVTLGGKLTVVNLAGTLVLGNSFKLISGAMSGTFSSYSLPALTTGLGWNISGLASGGSGAITVDALTANAGSPQAYCTGGSVTIGGSPTASGGSGTGYTYNWSPSTGLSSSTVANPVASPTSTQTYSVTVTDSLGDTSSPSSVTVTVNPLPSVSVNSATVCAGSPATLTATTSAGSPSYLWSPGGATTASITVSPASTTTYTVTVTSGTTGCANTGSGTVTVNPLPSVSVNSATVCAGSPATLTATTSAGSPSYLWSPGGATTASITVSPASTTTYTVTVASGTTGCANTGSGTVTVNPLPTITLGASPVLAYYSSTNASLPYTATSGTPDGYSISYDPTAQAAGFSNVALTALPASPIILMVPIAAGTNVYNGMLTVNHSSTGCTSTNYAFTVTVTNALSTSVVSSSANPADSGSNITFTATLSTLAPSLAVPSGTVLFRIDGSPFGSPVTLSNGVAVSAGISSLARGYHTNEADYAGNANIVGSTNSLVEFIDTPPVAGLATFSRAQNLGLIIAISDLMANATDVYDDPLSLVAVSASSTNGATIYTNALHIFYSPPAINGNVTDTFSYTVADTYGVATTGTVMVTIQPASNGPSVNITGISTNGNGTVTIGFAGIPGFSYLIQATTSLSPPPITWTTLSTNTAGADGLFQYTDLNATNYSSRYYRTATP
jgi:autotransporter-associated beta strand protein